MSGTSKRIIISILANVALYLNVNAVSDALKVKIINGSTSDETVVRFLPTATYGFDGSYDAYKMFSTNPSVPSIFTNIDSSSHLSINALPSFTAQTNIELYTLIKVSGTYTILATELGTGFPANVKIVLEDKVTGIVYNFRNGTSITLALTVNTLSTSNRFSLHVSPPMSVQTTNITCSGLNNGSIQLSKPGNHNWNFQLTDGANAISSGANINESSLITDLNPGSYTLYTSSNYSLSDTNTISISEPAPVIAEFSSNLNQTFLSSAELTFTNNSLNANSFSWDFGDGSFASDSTISTHQYLTTGHFNVKLVASNADGCSSAYSKTIIIDADLLPMVINLNHVVCHGTNSGSVEIAKPGNYDWNYLITDSNATRFTSGTHVYESAMIFGLRAGTYTLYTTSPFSNPDTTLLVVTEPAAVTAEFSSDYQQVYLSAATISFTNNSANANSFTWDFGDGSVAYNNTTTHQYLFPGTFVVTLTASDNNGCSSTSDQTIIVNTDLPMTINSSNVTCNASADGSIELTKKENHNWSYELVDSNLTGVRAGNNIDEAIKITNLNAGIYYLYTTSNLSPDTNTIMITEPEAVIAEFSIDYDRVYLSSATILFTNTSANANSFTWDFGDGSFASDSSSVAHQYFNTGNFNITLTATNSTGCGSAYTKTIIVETDLFTGIISSNETASFTAHQAEGTLYLDLQSSVLSKVMISVYNESGQIIYSYNDKTYALSEKVELKNTGIYFINSVLGNQVKNQKIAYVK
jgi:PKD repeat protein